MRFDLSGELAPRIEVRGNSGGAHGLNENEHGGHPTLRCRGLPRRQASRRCPLSVAAMTKGHHSTESTDQPAAEAPHVALVELARILAREAAREDVAALDNPDTASKRGEHDD